MREDQRFLENEWMQRDSLFSVYSQGDLTAHSVRQEKKQPWIKNEDQIWDLLLSSQTTAWISCTLFVYFVSSLSKMKSESTEERRTSFVYFVPRRRSFCSFCLFLHEMHIYLKPTLQGITNILYSLHLSIHSSIHSPVCIPNSIWYLLWIITQRHRVRESGIAQGFLYCNSFYWQLNETMAKKGKEMTFDRKCAAAAMEWRKDEICQEWGNEGMEEFDWSPVTWVFV